MKGKTIEIIVQPTGELSVDAIGFKGVDCEAATQFLEEALGALSDRKHKPEYNARSSTRTQQRIGR